MTNIRVLYVEDDEIQALQIQGLLETQGFDVSHCSTGYQALEAASQDRFDILLTDYRMPGMTGIELVSELSQHSIDLPAILLTAVTDISVAFEALKVGSGDVITKDSEGKYLNVIAPILKRTIARRLQQKERAAQFSRIDQANHMAAAAMANLKEGIIFFDTSQNVLYFNHCLQTLCELPSTETDHIITLSKVINGLNSFGFRHIKDKALITPDDFLQQDKEETHVALMKGQQTFLLTVRWLEGERSVAILSETTHLTNKFRLVQSLIDNTPTAILVVDPQGNIIRKNRQADLLTGYRDDDAVLNISQLLPEADQEKHRGLVRGYFKELTNRNMRSGMDVFMINQEKKEVPVEVSLANIIIGGENYVVASVVDLTERKKREKEIQDAHRLTQALIDAAPDGIALLELNGTVRTVNPALLKMLWYEQDDITEHFSVIEFFKKEDFLLKSHLPEMDIRNMHFNIAAFESLVEQTRTDSERSGEWVWTRKNGSEFSAKITLEELDTRKFGISGFLLTARDVTLELKDREYITHIAHHDALTGLPNRILLQDRIQAALNRLDRFGKKLAVMLLDLDHFKRINDSIGHMAGDKLLKIIAERLVKNVRESDTVCRIGGDEFVILLTDIDDALLVETVAKHILTAVTRPVDVGTNTLMVTTSVGAAIAPEHGTHVETLMKNADIAMYHSKQHGRNGYSLFVTEQAEDKQTSLAMEQSLHRAFTQHQIKLYYQPILDLANHRIIGYEALMRWIDPDNGIILPERFLPLAETTGFSVPLNKWALTQACADLPRLIQHSDQNIFVSVNVSQRQFENDRFLETLELCLHESKIDPHYLELDVTESIFEKVSKQTLMTLQSLKVMDVQVNIDNFGTGHSSLAHLTEFPVKGIKIDPSFNQIQRKENAAIVRAMHAISEGLDLSIMVAGVESDTQQAFFLNQGIHLLQGNHYCPPCALDQLLQQDNLMVFSRVQSVSDVRKTQPL